MDNSTVAQSDKIMAVVLLADEKKAVLPVEHLPLDDIQIAMSDGRIIHVRQIVGGTIIQVNDLDGDQIAELPIPAQKPELVAKAARLAKVAERLNERLHEVAKEAADALVEADRDEKTALPEVISLPGPTRLN